MSLRWLVRKEVTWSRHQVLALAFVLVVLPGAAAFTALGFQHVLPKDTPVAVAPQDGAVTDDDLAVAAGGLTAFSDPVQYDSKDRAMRALDRERVYGVVTVPPGLTDPETQADFRLYTDGDMVPYREPSRAVGTVLRLSLRQVLPTDVSVERVEVGRSRTLSEYLVPTFLLMILLLVAFAYLPYALGQEAAALDRVRFESSLGAVVGGKLALFSVLTLVPLATAAAASAHIGYDLALLSPGSVLVYLLTFVYAGAFASAVTVAARFRTWGRLVNLAALLFVLTFSGIVYPVGFFSALRRQVVRLVPVHYSAIVARGHVLRDIGVGPLGDMYAVLAVTTLVALGALKLSLVAYERGA